MQITTAVHCRDGIFNPIREVSLTAQERATITLECVRRTIISSAMTTFYWNIDDVVAGAGDHALTLFLDDAVVRPFTPLPNNPIRVVDFLSYVANHQNAMVTYKDEYQVGR